MNAAESSGASNRPSWSALPPGAKATTIFTGRTGQSCAQADDIEATVAATSANAAPILLIDGICCPFAGSLPAIITMPDGSVASALQRKSLLCYRAAAAGFPFVAECREGFMSVDAKTVRRIAHLARIAVADEEVEHLQAELNAMLAFVEQLSEVNVNGVDPMTSVTPMELKQRADEVTDGGIPDDILRNAPATQGHFFLVPKVIE